MTKWTDSDEKEIFVNLQTVNERKPALHFAKNVDVARNLLKNGANYNSKNGSGKTAADIVDDASLKSLLELTDRLYDKVKSGELSAKERAEIDIKDWPALKGSLKCQLHLDGPLMQRPTLQGYDEGHYLITFDGPLS